MTMYALNDSSIEQVLIQAHTQRGVETKALLDKAFHGQMANQSVYDKLGRPVSTSSGRLPGPSCTRRHW